MKASTTFSRLTSFFGFSPPLQPAISARRSSLQLLKVDRHQKIADRFGADHGGEAVFAIFVLGLVILVFGQKLALLERRQARLDDDVVLEIENALEILQRHVEHQADARRAATSGTRYARPGEASSIWRHAVAAHLLHRDFDAALLADDALVLHALVLAAQALVILHRPEDARAEQPVALRLEGAVVDRFRLLDLRRASSAGSGPGEASEIRIRSKVGTSLPAWKTFISSWFITEPSFRSSRPHASTSQGEGRSNPLHAELAEA